MNMLIRTVTVEDAEALLAMMNPILKTGKYSAMDGPVSLEEQRQFIRSLPEKALYLAAFAEDGKLLGSQDVLPWLEDDEAGAMGDITTFVARDAHRQGVGRSLFAETLKRARRLGYGALRAVVRGDNPTALAYYGSMGFSLEKQMARRHEKIPVRVEQVVLTRTVG